jgi:hypothetical protein
MQRKNKMMKNSLVLSAFRVILIYFFLLSFTGCGSDRFDVDLTGIQSEVELHRLDREFFQLRPDNFEEQHAKLQEKYGAFYQRYVENMLQLGLVDDPALKYSIASFLSNKDVIELAETVEGSFQNLQEEMEALNQAFSYYQYHFPNKQVPDVVTFIAGFDSKVAATEQYLGIGLDLYLGKDNEYYKLMQWPEYKRAQMDRERMPYDAMRGWLLTEFDLANNGNDLISRMITYGKVMYAMDAMFYNHPDHMKIGFSEKQIQWCKENETQIWSKLIESELLFSSNTNDIRRYISEGPFTPGMPKESPAQVSYWVGWEIVKAYIEEHPATTLEELMNIPIEGRKFLAASKYKPV